MSTYRSLRALLVLVSCAACVVNPVTGQREFELFSESREISMGREAAQQISAQIGLLPDLALQSWMNGIGQSIATVTERPNLPWEFKIVDDASVNAFALPGGFIFVTRGLLTQMTSEAELASVLGHEAGHVAARHSVTQMSRQQLVTLALGVGAAISPTIEKYGPVADAGLGLLFLKYGRDDELQADRLGYRYALITGYDTREMINVFRMFELQSSIRGEGRLPEWQSSHPDPGNRISTISRLVATSAVDFSTLRIGEAEFLRRLDGMVYGENPRLGFFLGGLFVHPDLAFSMRFPDGWTTRNAPDAVTAVSDAEDAMVQLRSVKGSVSEAAREFFAQDGLKAGAQAQVNVHGNRAIRGEFTARGDGGIEVRGIAQFIDFGGATWRITVFAVSSEFRTYAAEFDRSFESFARLTDAVALAVQPLRLRIVETTRVMTLTAFNVAQPSSVPLAELAMINGVDATAPLRAGQLVKRVIGSPPPQSVRAP